MRIAVVGTGYVGLVSGACFAEFGADVVCVDTDTAKIENLRAGRMPIFEPGLDLLVERNVKAGRLLFSTDLATSIRDVQAVFIAVGTPSRRGDGHADLTYVFAAAGEVAMAAEAPLLVVTKSTVPVGTGRKLQAFMAEKRPDLKIEVGSNPEFLREGSAIEDFMRPDRVVCGVTSDRARELLTDLYRPLYINETPMMFTTLETAELVKYASNCFLATKITFINEIADLCEAAGADVQQIAKGIGLDRRIGPKFLHAGPGYGGSCFPKDVSALLRTSEQLGVPLRLIETVSTVNDARKRRMVKKIIHAAGGPIAGRTIGVLGVTFKPNTDDMRDSPSLVIIPALQGEGARIRAFDPEGMAEGRRHLADVDWCEDPYSVAEGADMIVIMTEWNEFRGLDLDRLHRLVRTPVLVDLRNVLDPRQVERAGFSYTGIGRPSGWHPDIGHPDPSA